MLLLCVILSTLFYNYSRIKTLMIPLHSFAVGGRGPKICGKMHPQSHTIGPNGQDFNGFGFSE